MMGWVMLALVAVGAGGALLLLRLPRMLWTFAAAALTLGAAGYAWQGNPGLAGKPVQAEAEARTIDPNLVELRHKLFGQYNTTDGYFILSDAMLRAGSPSSAAKALLGGVNKYPDDAGLWAGLGLALTEQDGNIVSPAARHAFEEAIRIAPKHPGPYFYAGLAHVRAGEFAKARPYWAKALELTPEGASYREEFAMRLMLLDRFLMLQAEAEKRQGGAPAQPQP